MIGLTSKHIELVEKIDEKASCYSDTPRDTDAFLSSIDVFLPHFRKLATISNNQQLLLLTKKYKNFERFKTAMLLIENGLTKPCLTSTADDKIYNREK
jgi:hypothetical protein